MSSIPSLDATSRSTSQKFVWGGGHEQRRSHFETGMDILRAIRSGPNGKELSTHVMYKANLSWSVLQKYLKELEKLGLLLFEIKRSEKGPNNVYLDGPEIMLKKEGQKVFNLTDKGLQVLSSYEKLLEDMGTPRESPKTQMIRMLGRGFRSKYSDGSSKTVGRGLS